MYDFKNVFEETGKVKEKEGNERKRKKL